jgi:hypothetical protein
MYCHDLSAMKGKYKIQIPCEDLPDKEKTVGIWLYDIEASAKHKEELRSACLEWADKMEIRCKVYTSSDKHVTNENVAQQKNDTDA